MILLKEILSVSFLDNDDDVLAIVSFTLFDRCIEFYPLPKYLFDVAAILLVNYSFDKIQELHSYLLFIGVICPHLVVVVSMIIGTIKHV